jgi:hypothetical protein
MTVPPQQSPSRRALLLTNVVVVTLPLIAVGLLVAIGAQPASRVRSILLVVFALEALIFVLPTSWVRTGGIRPYGGGFISPGEFRTFMREGRAAVDKRPWTIELVAIGPGLAFIAVALSFLFF